VWESKWEGGGGVREGLHRVSTESHMSRGDRRYIYVDTHFPKSASRSHILYTKK
jgi:hypothetical protein